ncbi:MAG: DUF4160 domain-containing protein [Turicibacter sp.]|nr:DUF4160 domain-containing protein [Turicibacter sp.]
MPEISKFYGIRITMYYDEHNPPHIHAEYSGKKAVFDLDGDPMQGFIPKSQKRQVQAWISIHMDELYENWEIGQRGEKFKKIDPLK